MTNLFKINNATTYTFAKVGETEKNLQYIVKGDVAHYGVRNNNFEIDLAGCFSEHLKMIKDNNQTIPLVINHCEDESHVIGKFTEFEDGNTYLWGTAEIIKTPNIINEVIPKIEAGIYPCFSTYGWATDGNWDATKEAFIVNKAMLGHISLVSQGADLKAKATLEELKNKFEAKITKKSFFTFGFK
jgi:hypothetical protein